MDRRDNFHDACEKVRQKEKDLLWMSSDNQNDSTASLRGIRGKLWFSLSKRASHVGQLDLSRLSVQLVSLVAAERLELAYSVVETGLILFGTSWLSAISSTALKRFKSKQKPPRYVLDINEGIICFKHGSSTKRVYIVTYSRLELSWWNSLYRR